MEAHRVEIHLVQHGEAKREEEDPTRPLTDHGRRETERVARAAARVGVSPDEILHSGKRRAQETAEILASLLKPERDVHEMEGLAPMDDPAAVHRRVEEAAAPLMLVGHLPHLSRLAGLLLTGDTEQEVIAFRNSGIVCLIQEKNAWHLRWILTPELVGE